MRASERLDAWLWGLGSTPDSKGRLVCLPHAGGDLTPFRRWDEELPGIEVCVASLPGRWARSHEPQSEDLGRLVAQLGDALCAVADRPLAVLGYSFGALLGFELCRYLTSRAGPQAIHLFAIARPAPHLPRRFPPLHLLDDSALARALDERYGTLMTDEVRASPAVLQTALAAVRADARLNEIYEHRAGAPLNLPITAVAGRADRAVTEDEVDAWSLHTTRDFARYMLPGGHFIAHTQREVLLRLIARRLGPRLGEPQRT